MTLGTSGAMAPEVLWRVEPMLPPVYSQGGWVSVGQLGSVVNIKIAGT